MKRMIVLGLILSMAGCSSEEAVQEDNQTPTVEKQASTVRAVKIKTAKSSLRDMEITEQVLGRVLDPSSAMVAAEIPARVKKVLVDAGDAVKKGDVLARLDTNDVKLAVDTAKANLDRVETQYDTQARQVERYRTLAADKFISTTILDQAEAEFSNLQKAVNAAQAQYSQAKNNLARSYVKAPMAGTIQQRFVAAGDYIGVGKPMFQLVTHKHLVVSIIIPETKIDDVTVGLPVRMHRAGREDVVEATISELSPMIGSQSNAFAARINIDQSAGWNPGGSVITEIVMATHEQAVVVPEECIVLRPNGEVVYVIEGEVAKMKPVKIGINKDGFIEIVEGLSADETLAATGASFLSDGALVQVQGVAQ